MSQTGYTPISLYYSATASAAPVAGNLVAGELAINTNDGKLYYKDSAGVVQTLASKSATSGTYTNITVTGGSINGTTIGATTASTGAFTTLSASSTISGTGFSTYLASPPAIGSTAANTGAFTTLSASSTVSGTGFSTYLASPPAIGGTSAAAGSFTTLSASSTVTFSGGTANGVGYLNGSKVLTTGSALTFDGSNLTASAGFLKAVNAAGSSLLRLTQTGTSNGLYISTDASFNTIYNASGASGYAHIWQSADVEQMRLTSTGLGIGTSSPGAKLDIQPGTVTTVGARASTAISIENGSGAIGNLSQIGFGFTNAGASTNVPAAVGFITTATAGFTTGDLYFATRSVTTDTAPTERMRLDSAGNLGLGVTPSAWRSGQTVLQMGYANFGQYANATAQVGYNFYVDSGGTNRYIASSLAPTNYYQNSGQHVWQTAASGTAGNAISFTQAMTLDASGNLGLGTTSGTGDRVLSYGNFGSSGTGYAFGNRSTSASGSSAFYHQFVTNAGGTPSQAGSISWNGTIMVYGTGSDVRLKENIVDAPSALDYLNQFQIRSFDMKASGNHIKYGVIAQEMETVEPSAVSKGFNEDEMWMVDTSVLVPAMVKAIQEQQAIIEDMKSRLAAAGI